MFFSETCKVHRKDQEVCEMVVDSVSKLVPHLECVGNVTEAMTDNRNRVVQMIRIFWKLADKMYNCRTQSAIFRCLIAFIRVSFAQRAGVSFDYCYRFIFPI
jgi:hypothetical protein